MSYNSRAAHYGNYDDGAYHYHGAYHSDTGDEHLGNNYTAQNNSEIDSYYRDTHANYNSTLLDNNSKIVFVSSESGSIALRHESEGGGNYGHHASKAALNMCMKLLSIDLRDRGIAIVSVHPGFMRTEMTRNVGFDKFWDEGGAVEPDVAAESLVEWIELFDISHTGQYWAPRGPGDIGTADVTMGKDLPTPLQLPW